MSREAMELALEALENAGESVYARGGIAAVGSLNVAAQALRKALEEKREPVCWTVADGWVYADDTSQKRGDEKTKREHEWVGLTTDEMKEIADRYHLKPPNIPVAFRAIEQALKEKNDGH